MMALLQCTRCGDVGHDAEHCPFFRRTREAHADAQKGDNVRHMNQVNITIRVDGAIVEQCQREIVWFYNHKIEISVGNIHFVLGSAASGAHPSWGRPQDSPADECGDSFDRVSVAAWIGTAANIPRSKKRTRLRIIWASGRAADHLQRRATCFPPAAGIFGVPRHPGMRRTARG